MIGPTVADTQTKRQLLPKKTARASDGIEIRNAGRTPIVRVTWNNAVVRTAAAISLALSPPNYWST